MAGEDGNLTDAELAELAAFADGSLPADRRQAVAERVERSPELSAMVAEQRAALEAVGALDVRAPADLHARVGSRDAPALTRRRFGGLALAGGALAVVAAAALLAIVVVGAGDDPTIPQAAELASRGAESGAPEAGSPKLLAASVGGVSFPTTRRPSACAPAAPEPTRSTAARPRRSSTRATAASLRTRSSPASSSHGLRARGSSSARASSCGCSTATASRG